ncbi:hypothetical protein H0X06_00045 [Candidatus Dependentiae bacterium]|nr:hypothetical protein [Candidatus Dependentiae bacterium]
MKNLYLMFTFLTAIVGGVVSQSYAMDSSQNKSDQIKLYVRNDTAGAYAQGWNIQVNVILKNGKKKNSE